MAKKVSLTFFLAFALSSSSCNTTRYIEKKDKSIWIDVPSERVSVHCSPEDEEDKNSFTYVYVVGEKRIDEFLYRRPWPYSECLENKKNINIILNKNKIVSIYGVEKLSEVVEEGAVDDVGIRFENPQKKPHFTWFFSKVIGGSRCHGYFVQDCE